MELSIIREWLIQKGIPAEELDNVEKAPIAKDVISLKEKSKTSQEIYEELLVSSASLEELKIARINWLKEQCSNAIYEGFVSQSTAHTFGFNSNDQGNMTQTMLLIVADTANTMTTIQWKTKDAGVVEFSKEQFLIIVNEAKDHKLNQQYKYWLKEELILVAETVDELQSVTW